MKIKHLLLILSFLSISLSLKAQTDSVMLRRIYDEELTNGKCYDNLHYLCKNIGGRLSGSANAQKAVEWGKKLMESYGFDRVFLQEVMVPHWVRGAKEQGRIIVDKTHTIPVALAALGGSVATDKAGIFAEVIEVHSLQEVQTLGEAAIKGKIVFFNRPFDERYIETLNAYGMAGDQRRSGPSVAAKFGAVGLLVRSLTGTLDNFPHTGATIYDETVKKIPAAAISTMAANQLSELLKSKKGIRFFLKQNCETLPDVLSYNVVAEIKGTKYPNQFITVGGHLDSWDLAEGAHDDGTGIVQSAEVLRLFKTMGYHPQNSIRAVFFMNEENGHKGGLKYAELAKQNNEIHIAALETDLGGFTPRGFGFEGASPEFIKSVNQHWKKLLEPYNVDKLVEGEGGTDIGPLKAQMPAIQLIGYLPDSQRYFDVHHTPNDIFENVNKRELELGAASIASLIYLIDQHGVNFK